MKAIWKIQPYDNSSILLPIGAVFLSVQTQNDRISIWYLVDPEAALELKKFRFVATGSPCNIPITNFIGTVQLYNGSLVYHVFDITNPDNF